MISFNVSLFVLFEVRMIYNNHKVGKKLSDARSDEDMNGVVHQYVDMNARRSDNADDRLLTAD